MAESVLLSISLYIGKKLPFIFVLSESLEVRLKAEKQKARFYLVIFRDRDHWFNHNPLHVLLLLSMKMIYTWQILCCKDFLFFFLVLLFVELQTGNKK